MSKNQDEKKDNGRGFAKMSLEKKREIASKGGKKAHELGVAHEWDSEEAKKAVEARWKNKNILPVSG